MVSVSDITNDWFDQKRKQLHGIWEAIIQAHPSVRPLSEQPSKIHEINTSTRNLSAYEACNIRVRGKTSLCTK